MAQCALEFVIILRRDILLLCFIEDIVDIALRHFKLSLEGLEVGILLLETLAIVVDKSQISIDDE